METKTEKETKTKKEVNTYNIGILRMCPSHVVLEEGEGGEDGTAVTGDVPAEAVLRARRLTAMQAGRYRRAGERRRDRFRLARQL